MSIPKNSLMLLLTGLVLASEPSLRAETNGVLREIYTGLGGTEVAALTNAAKFPNNPDQAFLENAFEAPFNFADFYGQRMRALLLPPVTGDYVFWIASDNNSALYLSGDEAPAHKRLIAHEDSWTGSRQWNADANQKSAPITLTNGFRYYLEALQKEGDGGDNLAVTWQKPGDAAPADGSPPIPGAFLLPYGLGSPVISLQPTNVTVNEGGSANFMVMVAQKLSVSYQWLRNGAPIAGATNSFYLLAPVSVNDNGSGFSCAITNFYGNTNSAVAILTVRSDITPPSLNSVSSLGDPRILIVIFSEPLEAASATNAANYRLSGAVDVLSATFGADTRTILLRTTPMAEATTYTLTVNHVRDRATIPNEILPNSQRDFTLDWAPLDISFLRAPPEPVGPSTRRGPLIISEIMYHPTNRLDGKNLEYIELYNSSAIFEDISGFRLTGQVDYTFPSNTVLAARSYAVLAAAPADLQEVYGLAKVLGAYTNKLSHNSGTLRLRNREGGIVFEVSYSGAPPWPAAADGAGHSLVLARPSLGGANPAAWAASDAVGGSPGRAEVINASQYRSVMINEVLAHTDPPDLDFIELYNYSAGAVDLSGCILTDNPATNKFVIPTGTGIQPRGFLSYDENQLGFRLSAAGETVYLREPITDRVLEAVRFDAQENGISLGRFPDGAKQFYRLETKTPGAKNTSPKLPPVVLNEIMYDPISHDDEDQYVELYNHTAGAVDISRWTLDGAVNYTIPAGTVMAPQSYLVLAKNPARLLANYTNLTGANTLGSFSGTLAHRGERLTLARPDEIVTTNVLGKAITNTIHIVLDEVAYGPGGRWGKWAHGGGSSLELIDWHSDHRLAPNWADSGETQKSGWTTIGFTGVLDNGAGTADSLEITLLGPGECLVDQVEVFTAGDLNRITNSTFESGLSGWVFQGNHEDSSWESGQGYNSTHCLHVRATDHGDTGANRIRTRLSSALSSGQTATIRAKVRWLAGHPEILLRLHGNWLEATGNMLTARNLGTPGAPNSRAKPNAGPAITEVRHSPVLPASSQPVTVVAQVDDPDGLAGLLLKYRLDPSTNLNLIPMVNNGAGLFSATLPGQAAGKLIAFHVQAFDNKPGTATVTQFPNDVPARECLVRWGDPAQSGAFGTYRVWMTQAILDRWSKREHLSNKPLDCTFVYGNSRIIYNIGGEYSGSPWHAPGYDSPIGNVCDYLLTFPDDDSLLGETEATLQWPGNGGGDNTYQREQTAYWIAEQIGLPYCYRRSINLFVNGVRRAQMFEDVQQPNGDMTDEFYSNEPTGDLHKIQLWFEFDDAAVSFTANGASFQNVTTTGGQKKLAFYRWTFAKRAQTDSANNYTNLFALVDTANFGGLGAAYRGQLEGAIDVNNWLETYAVEHLVGNNDSFAYGGGQNMYCYKPLGDTWKMFIWDIDFAFASLPPTSDMFQGIGRSNGIDLSEPAYRRRYWQTLQDLANGPLVATKVNPVLDAKYSAMVANGRTIDSPSSIKSYLSQRRTSLLNLISKIPAPFALTLNGGAGFSTNRNLIALTGTAPIDVRSISINGLVFPVTWTSLSNWTAQVALVGGTNALLVQGWDAWGNSVTGATSTLVVNYTGPVELPQDKLVLNEIMYHPAASNAAYVELYNTSSSNAFDLSAWRLSGVDFAFLPGAIIAPNAYLVVAEDAVAFAAAYGKNIPVAGVFAGSLDRGGETLRLIKPGPTPAEDLVIDEVRYDSQPPWPGLADGSGASLQLIDPSQDNNRVANWAAVGTNSPQVGPQWRYVVASGTASSSTLYVYLQSAGEAYVDDIKLVSGGVAESGPNVLPNGDFESPFPGPWTVSPNLSASATSTTIEHSGNLSLHVVASSGGTTRSSAIYQDIVPGLAQGAQYMLSFWYLENPNGGTLTIRLSGSGIVTNVNLAPSAQPIQVRATPGAVNSVKTTLPPLPRLWLNEVQPNNQSGAMDRFGHRHPWLELYNSGPTNLSLSGTFLANNYSNLLQWPFAPGASIAPGQFLVVWLDGNPGESAPNELHAGFTVPPNAGSVALVSTNAGLTNLLDYLNYHLTQADRSYGAYPDGSASRRQSFYYPTPGGTNNPSSPPLNVFINEWMADNKTTLADPADGDFEDWFEIFNPGDSLADLSGFYLGTSLTNKTKFRIPDGYTIGPKGYLLVWADAETAQNSSNRIDLHVNFKLSRDGEAIGLFGADGTVVDYVEFGAQAADVSQGRVPDGSGPIYTLVQPTPGAANQILETNTPPILGAISNYLIIDGELLAFTIVASDNDPSAQHLTFSLASGAPPNANINPETGFFSWRATLAEAAATNEITVRVSDDGFPPLSATATFTVWIAPRPRITAIQPNGNNGYSLTFATIPNRSYQVQFKNALEDSEWQPLAPPVTANGDTLTLADELGSSAQRFYRIVVGN